VKIEGQSKSIVNAIAYTTSTLPVLKSKSNLFFNYHSLLYWRWSLDLLNKPCNNEFTCYWCWCTLV